MEEPEVHSHHHGGHSGHRWFDIAVSVCAIVVSLVSLYLAIHHGQVMQQMAEANARMVTATSWPSVNYSTSNVDADGKPTLQRFTLSNKGIGPARVDGMEVRLEGKPVKGVRELLQACCGSEGKPPELAWQLSTVNGEILRPGEDRHFLHLPRSPDAALWAQVTGLPGKLSVKVCYCSVFDECWVADSMVRKPAKVAACPTDWVQYGD